MQEAHQHPTLMILPPKKRSQDLDFSLLRAWTKPIHSTIQSQMAKARQQLVVAFSAEGSGGQPFGGSDERHRKRNRYPLIQPAGHAGVSQPA